MSLIFIRILLRHRFFVFALSLVALFLGLYFLPRVSVDALPDLSPVEVQVLIPTPLFPPDTAEQSVARPVEWELAGLHDLTHLRSLIRFGIIQITLQFAEGTDLLRARQLVTERLQSVQSQLPTGITPRLGPLSTGLGEIYSYEIKFRDDSARQNQSEQDQLCALKLLQTFNVRPFLRSVSGVSDINSTGGFDQEVVLEVDPNKANGLGSDLTDTATALFLNTIVNAGTVVNEGTERKILRASSQPNSLEQIANLPIRPGWNGENYSAQMVGNVKWGVKPRNGAATVNGKEAVLGTVLIFPGENVREVAQRLNEKIKELANLLPPDVEILPLYDRSQLVNQSLQTISLNLLGSAVLVLGALFLCLGQVRAALITAAAIPLSFLGAITLITWLKIPVSLMSFGALDFGLVVDGSVVMVDAILMRWLLQKEALQGSRYPEEIEHVLAGALRQMGGPLLVGLAAVALAYLPIFAFTDLEARLFQPMAWVVLSCLAASALCALILVPLLTATFCLSSPVGGEDHRFAWIKNRYATLLASALPRQKFLLIFTVTLVLGALILFFLLPREFTPKLEEGSLVLEIQRATNLNLDTSLNQEKKSERAVLKNFPEVIQTYSRLGYSDITTDGQLPSETDLYFRLKPRSQWRWPSMSKAQLTQLIQETIHTAVPDQKINSSQPIEVRLNESLEGVKTDVVVKIFGPDFDQLQNLSTEITDRLSKLSPQAEVEATDQQKTTVVSAEANRKYMQLFAVWGQDINRAVAGSVLGVDSGVLYEGDHFYPVVTRLPASLTQSVEGLKATPLHISQGGVFINLGQTTDFKSEQKVTSIEREENEHRVDVLVNYHGNNLLSWVEQAQGDLATFPLPEGYRIKFAGAYQRYGSAQIRLLLMVPILLLAMFGLLSLVLSAFRQILLVLLAAPLAVLGGILALSLAGLPLGIGATLGLLASVGLAILNCLVKVTYINQMRTVEPDLQKAVIRGALDRIRPVLMTALVALVGLVPMAISSGVGAEIQRPLAVAMIGGILSSSLLTLILTPLAYLWLEQPGVEHKTI